MRLLSCVFAVGAMLAPLAAADPAPAQDADAGAADNATADAATVDVSQQDRDAAYLLGYMVAQERMRMFEEFGMEGKEDFLAGVTAAVTESDPRVDPARAEEIFQAVQERIQEQQGDAPGAGAPAQQDPAANKAAGEAFLQDLRDQEGVSFTDSGLAYEVMEEGEGPKPAATDTVKVHYTGKLIDGTVFDSSVERGAPATFPLNRVIPGWTEGLQLMSEGAKYRFYIPSELAYGEQAPPSIGPNQVLVFDVELLDVLGEE
jgi:FKBP-type peptidyl-prolyl cis-trans isomerase